MDDDFDFTDDEIREELAKLGYVNVPSNRLLEFRRDLEALVRSERSSETGRDTWSGADSVVDQSQCCVPSRPSAFVRDISDDREPQHGCPRPASSAALGSRPGAGPSMRGSGVRQIKRKVVRRNGERCESTTGSETDDMSYIEERFEALSARLENNNSNKFSKSNNNPVSRPPISSPDSAGDQSHNGETTRERPCSQRSHRKALIHGMNVQPHTQALIRNDPVSAYHRYKSGWTAQRAPGERAHKDLRWAIREKMVYHDNVVEKKEYSYRPNSYVVPTDKKRKSLRWQVREDLAQGVVRPASALSIY